MNCREFELLLPGLVGAGGGDEDGAERAEALRHGASCDRCGRLLAVARGEVDLVTGPEAEVSIRAILQRTTGEACATAEGRLPDWADGLLPAADAELLAVHLAHCPGCRVLVEALVMLRADLPALAQADPGPEFAVSVLAQTSRSADSASRRAARHDSTARRFPQRRSNRASAGSAPIRDQGRPWLEEIREAGSTWARYWAAVMRRPRASLELAYGASLIFCLVVPSPATQARGFATEVTALVSRVPTPRLIMASVIPADGLEGATGSLRGLISKVEDRAPGALVARLVRAWKRAAVTAVAVRNHGPVLGQALLRLDLVGVWREAEAIRLAGKKGSEPVDPAVRPENDGGMATPGRPGDGPAASKGGIS